MLKNSPKDNCLFAGLIDEQQKVRTITALALAALAEAATPYGIESFDSVLKPLWKGIRQHRGKVRQITAKSHSDHKACSYGRFWGSTSYP